MPIRYDFQKIDQSLLISNVDNDIGHGSSGQVKSAESTSWGARTVTLRIDKDGDTINLNRGSLIEFLKKEGCTELDKGFLGGIFGGGSEDNDIQEAFDKKFKGKDIFKIDDSPENARKLLEAAKKNSAALWNNALKNSSMSGTDTKTDSSDDLPKLREKAGELAESLDEVLRSRTSYLGFARNSEPSILNLVSALSVFSAMGDFSSKIATQNASGQGSSAQPDTVADTFLLILKKDNTGGYAHGGIRDTLNAIHEEIKADKYSKNEFSQKLKEENLKLAAELERIIKFVEGIPSLKILAAESTKKMPLPTENMPLPSLSNKMPLPIVFKTSSVDLPKLRENAGELAESLDKVLQTRTSLGFYRNSAPSVRNLVSALSVFSTMGDFSSKIATESASGQGSSVQPDTVADTLLLIIRKDNNDKYVHGGIRDTLNAIKDEIIKDKIFSDRYPDDELIRKEIEENLRLAAEIEKIIKFVEGIPVE